MTLSSICVNEECGILVDGGRCGVRGGGQREGVELRVDERNVGGK